MSASVRTTWMHNCIATGSTGGGSGCMTCRGADLPDGTFVDLDGTPALVTGPAMRTWAPGDGYSPPTDRPVSGTATVITPAANVAVLRAGYRLAVNPAVAAT